MNSQCEKDVMVDYSAVKQTSGINFQQKENCNAAKNIFLGSKNDSEVGVSENDSSPDNKTSQTFVTEIKEESENVRNITARVTEISHNHVVSSPNIQQRLENDRAEWKSTSKELDFESGDLYNGTDKIAENIGTSLKTLAPEQYYSPDYKKDDTAYFLAEELLEEISQSNSSLSLSSCDASFSHSDDEDLKQKCCVQSTPNSGFTITYNDFQKSTKPVQDIKSNGQSSSIEKGVKETKISLSLNDTKITNEVLILENTETNNQRSQAKNDGESSPSQSETKVEKSCNVGATFQKPRHDSTNPANAFRNQDVAAKRKSSKKSNFVKPIERPSAVAAAFPKSRTVTTPNPAKNQIKDAVTKSPENVEFVKPDEETAAKIVSRVEFYFNDFNILKNNFLLKHARKNKEGYVSLKLITSFRKVKAVTKDWQVVAYSLSNSKLLKLNPEKTKVCRIEPIPKIEDTSFGKTVIVFNLPFQNQSSEQLKELFSKFGNIVHAEIMTSKSINYNLYHKKCLFFNRNVATATFGVVEFESYKDALSSLKDEESNLPKENKMVVVPLVAKYYKFKPKKSFRYKSTISYPENPYGGFGKSEYPRDIYAVNFPNAVKYGKYYYPDYYDERVPRSNQLYRANYGYYPQQSDQHYFYPKQKMIANNVPSSKNPPKYSNGRIKYNENWRQNRYLKANNANNMNTDKRFVHSSHKTEAN